MIRDVHFNFSTLLIFRIYAMAFESDAVTVAFSPAVHCFYRSRVLLSWWTHKTYVKYVGYAQNALFNSHACEGEEKWFLAWQLRFFSLLFSPYTLFIFICFILACIHTFRLFITCNRLKSSWQQLPWKTQVSAWTCLFRYAYLRMCWEKKKWEVHI